MRMFKYISLLFAFAALQANAQFTDVDWSVFERDSVLPVYSEMIDIGDDYLCYDYKAAVEYPEFQRMSAAEIERYGLKALYDSLPAYPQVDVSVSISAKRGQLDISFIPVVRIEDCLYRINSFKLALERSFNAGAAMSRISSRASASSRYASSSVLSSGKWVKIKVTENGVHKITHSELARMGFSNPDRVRLYGYGGHMLPEIKLQDLSDDLQEVPLWREDGYVLFYANATESHMYKSGRLQHTRNVYSEYGCYFLSEGDAEPLAFPQKTLSATIAGEVTAFPDYIVYEKDEKSLCTYGRVLLDGYNYANGRSVSYNFDLKGVSGDRATLDLSFGSNATSSSSVTVEVNGTEIGSLGLSAAGSSEKGRISQTTLAVMSGFSDNPTVKLTHKVNDASLSGHLDYIRINFTRNLALYGSSTCFRGNSTSGNATFKVASATPTTHVWQVTDAGTVSELMGDFADGVLTVVAPASRNERLVAVDVKGSFPSVTVAGVVPCQNLHALGQTDMVIIIPSNGNFAASAARLAQAHEQHDGLTVAVVTAEQVYNEFSSGTPDATAYRRLMKMLYDRADTPDEAPKYLLLFGDGLTDNRLISYSRYSQENLLLTYQSENSVSTIDSYVLEDYFAYLDDNEGGDFLRNKIDISVGRIPAQTVADADGVVNKLIAYMNNEEFGSWQNVVALMGDDGDKLMPNQHMKDAENIATLLTEEFPAFMLDRIYWDDYPVEVLATGNSYPLVTEAIYNRLAEGALIMNYSGHGSPNLLSHEMAWKASDMAAVSSPRMPFWVTASCDIGPFDMGDGSVGEAAILNPNGAAIGLLTTTRTVMQSYNAIINKAFMKALLSLDTDGSLPAVGDALRKAKCNVISLGSDLSENKLQFILLGDPALRLNMPRYNIVIEKFNEQPLTVTGQVSAGGTVTVEGYVATPVGELDAEFTGVVSSTLFDCIEEIVTRDNIGIGAYTYTDYPNKLFAGSDSVKNGRFKLSFPVPMDISYRDEPGLLNLFAIDTTGISAQGYYDNFIVGGTAPSLADDCKGPEIKMYLNTPEFIDGDEVNATPYLFVELFDENGINTVGTGIGHDIVAMVDNDEKHTYNLNSVFKPVVGDYRQGTLEFLIDELEAGEHTLVLRAWDLFNNSSTDTIYFNVVPNLAPEFVDIKVSSNPLRSGQNAFFTITHDRPYNELDITIELYNFQGQKLWQHTEKAVSNGVVSAISWNATLQGGQTIPTGVYLYRAKLSSNGSEEQTKTRKIIILNNK